MMKKENSELDKLKIECFDLMRQMDFHNIELQKLKQELAQNVQRIAELEKAGEVNSVSSAPQFPD